MLGLALAAVFVVLNGFFVTAEFALVKLQATRGVRGKKSRRSAAVDHVVERLDRYLGVTQLGVTLASLGLGWIGEPAIAEVGDRAAMSVLGHALGPTGHAAVAGVAFALLTLVHVLFGELIPKLVAIQRSYQMAVIGAPLLRALFVIVYPALYVLEFTSRGVLKMIGLPFDAYSEAALSEDEILGIIAANLARGPRGETKRELLRRVMAFSQRNAKSAMVPRVDVASLSVGTPGREAMQYMLHQQYSRIVLTKAASLDEVVGYLYVKDLLFDPRAPELPELSSLRRDVLFVPETQSLDDVLKTMQRGHAPFAVVVDEYGGTSGIVTMEDLLEEIVGEIRDELDVEAARIEKRGEAWEVDGGVTLDELRSIGLEVPEDERGDSVSAAVLSRLGRLPRIGDRVGLSGGLSAEVISVSRRRVTRVRVRPAAPAA